MMRLLETMNIIAAWNSSKKIVFTKVFLKLVLLFQTLQLIAQRPIASIYEKPKKYLLIKVYGNMCTQLSPREPAHVSKPKKKTLVGGKGLRVGKQSLFIPNQKGQLETHTKEPSL